MEFPDVAADTEVPTRYVSRAIVYDETHEGYRFLLLKTGKGYWQNPQGGVDPGESGLEASLRETTEETALSDLKPMPWSEHRDAYMTEREGESIYAVLTAYAVKADSSRPVALSLEDKHEDYEWVSFKEARSRLTRYPEQRRVFDTVLLKAGICEDYNP